MANGRRGQHGLLGVHPLHHHRAAQPEQIPATREQEQNGGDGVLHALPVAEFVVPEQQTPQRARVACEQRALSSPRRGELLNIYEVAATALRA